MKKIYNHKEIEKFVQKFWNKKKTFITKEDKYIEKYYCLSMIPYPSGNLHMGHIRNYTIGDVIARYQRMLGKNVLHPMGWDAFGLPAENAAIKNNKRPSDWTYKNIKKMKKQLKSLGYSYDWNRELITCKPEYYKWEQWFFIKLYKSKLIYKKKSLVNWCKNDKTVLANEQVINGKCWRCDEKIIQKRISQWFLKITKYAEELFSELKNLTLWPEEVKTMQRNWIGRTKGIEICFKILKNDKKIKIFTTNPNFLKDFIYIKISIRHKLTKYLLKNNISISKFVNKYKNFTKFTDDSSKNNIYGINTNLFAINPVNENKIPIWISNFNVTDYNYYAKICIPNNNKKDLLFAKKYNIYLNNLPKVKYLDDKLVRKKNKLYNFNEINNLKTNKLNKSIKYRLLMTKQGIKKIKYKLRDWNISRQRYWGTPIPIAISKSGKIKTVPENKLPIILPENIKIKKRNKKIKLKYKPNKIKINKEKFSLERDTLDTFFESSWYYARYTCPNYKKGMLDSKTSDYWLPIDYYIGGIEHATMHLLYFRFYHKLLRDFGFVKTSEPAKKLLCQGMVISDTFYYISKNNERIWISPEDVIIKRNKIGKIINIKHIYGKKIIYDGKKKMSKSKNNGINPEEIIKKYGADTIRLFIMFAAPVNMPLDWNESGIIGMNRFLHRFWKIVFRYKKYKYKTSIITYFSINKQIIFEKKLYETINKVSKDIEMKQSFNTAISSIMKLINELTKIFDYIIQNKKFIKKIITIIIKMLYPFTPHFCFILWKEIYGTYDIEKTKWPAICEKEIIYKNFVVIIQINGKKKGIINISNNLNDKEIKKMAINKIYESLNNKKIIKIIYIPKKILNIVTN
ncbi:Leucyl-tRNA synthetase [Candidatus Purcelliella pentastirinorum]|uniref:Leucine--tRNA ligase n=1 Tax=Candidatus Purcelliella pentastirinorum TaxID=472834 RepID=A0A346DZ62_9ENTR|nr:leucine--tRNA ligase [Candidatus Purcelliella pentastirinorum]AXN02017.1 Leucyl-tRNA synthetase [Candidatus Purcelliella pentastirinorum]